MPVVPVVPAVPAVVAPAPARDPASFDDEEFDEGGRSVATIPAPVRAPASVRSDARPVAAADPWRDAVVVGAAAAASGCLAGCTPLGCVGVCPPLVCASPVLACGGAVAGGVSTHTALHDDDDQQPFIIGAIAAAGILVGGMVGGGLGVVWGAATSTDQLTNAGVGALIGTSTLGVVLAGVGVAVAELWVVDARPAARPAGEAE